MGAGALEGNHGPPIPTYYVGSPSPTTSLGGERATTVTGQPDDDVGSNEDASAPLAAAPGSSIERREVYWRGALCGLEVVRVPAPPEAPEGAAVEAAGTAALALWGQRSSIDAKKGAAGESASAREEDPADRDSSPTSQPPA